MERDFGTLKPSEGRTSTETRQAARPLMPHRCVAPKPTTIAGGTLGREGGGPAFTLGASSRSACRQLALMWADDSPDDDIQTAHSNVFIRRLTLLGPIERSSEVRQFDQIPAWEPDPDGAHTQLSDPLSF